MDRYPELKIDVEGQLKQYQVTNAGTTLSLLSRKSKWISVYFQVGWMDHLVSGYWKWDLVNVGLNLNDKMAFRLWHLIPLILSCSCFLISSPRSIVRTSRTWWSTPSPFCTSPCRTSSSIYWWRAPMPPCWILTLVGSMRRETLTLGCVESCWGRMHTFLLGGRSSALWQSLAVNDPSMCTCYVGENAASLWCDFIANYCGAATLWLPHLAYTLPLERFDDKTSLKYVWTLWTSAYCQRMTCGFCLYRYIPYGDVQ